MSFLGGIGINPVSLLATAALGPMGGLVSQFVGPMLSNIGQQVIQNLGQKLNLPQSAIDMAQGEFAASVGDFKGAFANTNEAIDAFGKETKAALSEIGDQQRQMQKTIRDIVSQMSESQDFKDAKASRGKGGSSGAPGWLMAMAKVLGQKLDKMADDMEQRAASISEKDPSSSAEFGVVSQQFSMLMNATNNAIKTIGEALAGMARKQG